MSVPLALCFAMLQKDWKEVRNPTTGRLLCKYCPQTHQIEVVERGRQIVVQLPAFAPVISTQSR